MSDIQTCPGAQRVVEALGCSPTYLCLDLWVLPAAWRPGRGGASGASSGTVA